MALSSVKHNKPVLPRTSDGSDLGSNRASIYSGKALSFDGTNDSVEVDNSFFNENVHTVCGYIKKDGTGTYRTVFGVDKTHAVPQAGLYIQSPNVSTYFKAHYFSETDNEDAIFSSSMDINVWYHFALTFDNGDIKAYWNGELADTGTLSGTWTKSGNVFVGAGWYNNAKVDFWDGDASDIKTFNVALTAAQVKELYDNPEQAVPTGVDATSLVLHLPMTEGAGSYVYNANAGAIGTELISNAGFDETCQKWGTTDDATVEIAGGKAIWTNAPLSGSFVEQPLELEVGKFYRVSFDYTSTMFNIFVNLGNTQQAVPLGNGKFTYDMYYGTGNKSIKFQHGWTTSSSASVDNVSIKEVVPNYYNGTINGATWVSGLPEPLPQTALMDWNKVDINTSVNQNDYYSGNITIGSSSGTIICRHIPYTRDNAVYYYGLGSNNTGYQRAIGSSSNRYWSVGYGNNPQDFTTNATVDLGDVTDISNSWDADHNVTIHKNGNFIQTASKTLADITGTRSVYLYRSAWSNGNEQAIVFWAYYDRKLTTKEINDVYTGAVDPEDVADLKYFFSKSNGYSYNGVTLTKTGSFTEQLSSEGSTAGKDVFGNTITNPRASGAYNFDGNSWAEVQDNASIDLSDANASFEAWVYHIDKGSASQYIINKFDGTTGVRFRTETGNNLGFYASDGTNNIADSGTYSLTANAWNHIVLTTDGTNFKRYINGALVDTDVAGTPLTTFANADSLYIGSEQTNAVLTESRIANPRIYNYALTAEQVADNFNEKASTFGGTKVASELDAYIERTASDGATVEAHSCLVNYLTELDKK